MITTTSMYYDIGIHAAAVRVLLYLSDKRLSSQAHQLCAARGTDFTVQTQEQTRQYLLEVVLLIVYTR